MLWCVEGGRHVMWREVGMLWRVEGGRHVMVCGGR